MKCACGSGRDFQNCCEPLLTGKSFAETAEQLMRSRYVAYATANISYLENTLAPESRTDFDAKATKQWAQQAKWKNLKIITTEKGMAEDNSGVVEFVATYEHDGQGLDHHEVSQFRKIDNRWYFIDGDAHTHREGEDHNHGHVKPQTVVRDQPKVGRNDPCTCRSGKKYKKCCGTET